tara:strand:+ start:11318 stop:12370 length:1053 start_codon:yes stop_codon:yes gene_type:complete
MTSHLVSGASGYLGSNIVKHLVKLKHNVVSFDVIRDENIAKISNFYQVDITNKHSLEKIFKENKIDYIHHNAALVPLTKQNNKYIKVNYGGTKNILELASKYKIKHFSHMSSSAIFGNNNYMHKKVDTNNYNPIGKYGYSKYLAEIEVLKSNIDQNCKIDSISIIRPRPVIGKGRLGIFEILFDWIDSDCNIPIIGDGTNRFQFAHVDDLSQVSIETAIGGINGIFNIGTDKFTNLKNDLEEFIKIIGSNVKIIKTKTYFIVNLLRILDKINLSPLSVWHYMSYSWDFYYDLENTFKVLKWRPKYSNVEMLVESYEEYKQQAKRLENNTSPHRKKVKQKILKHLKFLFKR